MRGGAGVFGIAVALHSSSGRDPQVYYRLVTYVFAPSVKDSYTAVTAVAVNATLALLRRRGLTPEQVSVYFRIKLPVQGAEQRSALQPAWPVALFRVAGRLLRLCSSSRCYSVPNHFLLGCIGQLEWDGS
jgi:hypothetical protein